MRLASDDCLLIEKRRLDELVIPAPSDDDAGSKSMAECLITDKLQNNSLQLKA